MVDTEICTHTQYEGRAHPFLTLDSKSSLSTLPLLFGCVGGRLALTVLTTDWQIKDVDTYRSTFSQGQCVHASASTNYCSYAVMTHSDQCTNMANTIELIAEDTTRADIFCRFVQILYLIRSAVTTNALLIVHFLDVKS